MTHQPTAPAGFDGRTPTERPLIERDKDELVRIIERLKEELAWYVAQRNRLLEVSKKLDGLLRSIE